MDFLLYATPYLSRCEVQKLKKLYENSILRNFSLREFKLKFFIQDTINILVDHVVVVGVMFRKISAKFSDFRANFEYFIFIFYQYFASDLKSKISRV